MIDPHSYILIMLKLADAYTKLAGFMDTNSQDQHATLGAAWDLTYDAHVALEQCRVPAMLTGTSGEEAAFLRGASGLSKPGTWGGRED